MAEINYCEFNTDKKRKLKLEILSKIKKETLLKGIKFNLKYLIYS